MRTRTVITAAAVAVVLVGGGTALAVSTESPSGHRTERPAAAGGKSDVPVDSPGVLDAASFAVDEHNTMTDQHLKLGRVLHAQRQVVAGTMYFLRLRATDGTDSAVYEAQVQVKPWQNFKELKLFKAA
ncbi:cystatin family protein [Streptomyces sp. NPDC002537]